jgi:pimeloyl-ACP methyl ester carboxylesterase
MATFVLVHGGWHGAWYWARLTPLLREAGHDVLAPTLTGLGERAHLVSPAVDLTTHVQDIVDVLEYEDLDHVVLVGHSYGGMVITGVAERASERLAQLVYLDAFVPGDGQSALELLPPERRAQFEAAERDGLIPLDWRAALAGWGVSDEADLRWMIPRMTAQPLASLRQPIASTAAARRLPRTFIHCRIKPAGDSFRPFAEQARSEGWPVHELDAGHDAMVTMPRELAELLLAGH